jgi:cytochrome c-type biogenesis protein CcmF
LQKETEFVGKIGDTINFEDYTIRLHDIKFAESANYYRQIAEFWLQNNKDNTITILKPENRLYKIEQVITQDSDIYSFLTYDLYVVLSKVDNDIVHANIYYRPFISFIWLALVIICGAFLLSILNENGELRCHPELVSGSQQVLTRC